MNPQRLLLSPDAHEFPTTEVSQDKAGGKEKLEGRLKDTCGDKVAALRLQGKHMKQGYLQAKKAEKISRESTAPQLNGIRHTKALLASSLRWVMLPPSLPPSTSDSDDSEYRRRERRRIRRSRKERGRRARDEDSDKEERRRKRQRKERDIDSEERKREESGESEQERRRKKRKKHGKQRRKEKKSQEEDFDEEGGEKVMDSLKPEDMMDSRKYTEVHIQAEISVEQGEGGQDEPVKPKYRKEKKKMKEKVDTRTEEEKLWDDSILGC
ncbi:zinc finger matrin-type protein 1-like protein [Lates japonicus]|uniref:Zinc finger matrin-type protein 1-like protein n=1 Tax=Lates japonicus TaxID=270547 RepID=A0AAD3NIV1_LATJO|nr:zinc finger matrin-type protein 1-like protein [Lates japonicus]